MNWELPLTGLIFVVGAVHIFQIRSKSADYVALESSLDALKKEMEEYKKRVDSLMLRTGFKL